MIVVLTGGTGGAKLIEGLAAETDPAELTIICNTGDDSIFHGLYVSPDIDTITYTLAGLTDSDKGWGIKDDTFNALEQLGRLGDDTWFRLGDKDLATHITRTRLLNEGFRLSQATDRIRRALGIKATILPMADERVETRVQTPQGEISFQEFFVKDHWSSAVTAIRFARVESSRPAPGVLEAIERATAIIVCSEQSDHQYRTDPRCAGNSLGLDGEQRAEDRRQSDHRRKRDFRPGAQTHESVRAGSVRARRGAGL